MCGMSNWHYYQRMFITSLGGISVAETFQHHKYMQYVGPYGNLRQHNRKISEQHLRETSHVPPPRSECCLINPHE